MTDLYGNKYINDNNTTQEGFPISSWYGYVADGYFQSKEEINNYPVYGNNKDNVKPGYIKYKDISGPEGVPDGQITDADRTIIGDPQPRYSFSLNLGAEWNNFDFNVFYKEWVNGIYSLTEQEQGRFGWEVLFTNISWILGLKRIEMQNILYY